MAGVDIRETVLDILDSVSFLKKYPLLVKATWDDSNPTPGYLYQDIIELSHLSVIHCQKLVDYLNDRLTNISCHIKLKVLKIMIHLCQRGHPDFRTILRRNSVNIHDSASFSGEPDLLHGIAPYIAVRKTAEELSEMLFNVRDEESELSYQQRPTSSLCVGFGGSAKKHMEGFGNSGIQRPDSWLGKSIVLGLKGVVGTMLDSTVSNEVINESQHKHSYQPVQISTCHHNLTDFKISTGIVTSSVSPPLHIHPPSPSLMTVSTTSSNDNNESFIHQPSSSQNDIHIQEGHHHGDNSSEMSLFSGMIMK